MSYKNLTLHKTVLVNLDTGRCFRGALLHVKRDVLVLANAEIIEPGDRPLPVPGSVVVERKRVEFVQVVS
jgi:hypothetical protein